MGIYIKGMEMPKEGRAFAIAIHPDGTITSWSGRDMPQYEAIPISPHGDLIDRNALLEKHYGRFGEIDEVAREAIKAATVIIPASDD